MDLAGPQLFVSTTVHRTIVAKTSTGQVVEVMGTILGASRSAKRNAEMTQQSIQDSLWSRRGSAEF